jgi:hypothetical protein
MSNSTPPTLPLCEGRHCEVGCCVSKGTEEQSKLLSVVPESYFYHAIFCGSFWGRIHLLFVIIFAIAFVTFFIFLLGFELRLNNSDPNILCADGLISYKLVLAISSGGICVIASIYFACNMSTPIDGPFFARCGIVFGLLFFLMGIALTALPTILSWWLESYIFIRSFNNSLYYCPFTWSSMSSNPVLFSKDMVNSSEFICEFWSSEQFCRIDRRPDFNRLPWVNMGGIHGAYHCQSSHPEIPGPCSTYFDAFRLYGTIESICILFFAFVLPIMCRACSFSASEEHSNICLPCPECCRSCSFGRKHGETQPLFVG